MPELSNENLSLWLKARDGLPCEEARALIEAHNDLDAEFDAHLAAQAKMYSQDELEEAQSRSYEEGESVGRGDALREVRALESDLNEALLLIKRLQDRISKMMKQVETV